MMRSLLVGITLLVLATTAAVSMALCGFMFMPSVAAQSQEYAGTWVGSIHGKYTEPVIQAGIPDTVTVDFTVDLTIRVKEEEFAEIVKEREFDGSANIVINKVTWVETDPYTIVKSYTLTPAAVEVRISGFISPDDKLLSATPEKGVVHHVKMDYSFTEDGKEVPQPTYETDREFTGLTSGYISLLFTREGNTITILRDATWPDVTVTGTLVLQKEVEAKAEATCIDARGDAKVLRNGKEEAVSQGGKIVSGDLIATGPDGGVTLLLPDGSQLKIHRDSAVRLEKLLGAEKAIELRLLLGRIWLRVKSIVEALKPRDKFEVHTPVCVTAPRGTEFTLEVSQNGTTTLIVLNDTADFSDIQGAKTVTVGQNQRSVVKPGGVPSDPVPIDARQIEAWWEEKPSETQAPYTIRTHDIVKMEDKDMISTRRFLTTDKAVYLFFEIDWRSVEECKKTNLIQKIYDAEGTIIEQKKLPFYIEVLGAGQALKSGAILLFNITATTKLGTWRVEWYDADKLLFTEEFEVASPTAPTTTATTKTPSRTITTETTTTPSISITTQTTPTIPTMTAGRPAFETSIILLLIVIVVAAGVAVLLLIRRRKPKAPAEPGPSPFAR